mgnify:CR=1 FL=1
MGKQILTNSNFVVSIGNQNYGFSNVSNIVTELPVEQYFEGGNNWHPHILISQKRNNETLVLKGGIATDISMFSIGEVVKDIVIMVVSGGKVIKNYSIDSGVVAKCELDGLDALDGSILIRTVEILHSGIHEN